MAMTELSEFFVDRVAAAILEAGDSGEWWLTASDSRRDRTRDQARAALAAVGMERGSASMREAAGFLLSDQESVKAGAHQLPAASVVQAVLSLLIDLSNRDVDIIELVGWLSRALENKEADLPGLAEILEGR
jgi:hypothetical protein